MDAASRDLEAAQHAGLVLPEADIGVDIGDAGGAAPRRLRSALCTGRKRGSPKHVSFAPEPWGDLREHHRYLDERRQEKRRSNPMGKIPPELAYLDRRPGPRPLTNPFKPTVKPQRLEDIRDRRLVAIKDISLVNKDTELNFNYAELRLPVPALKLLVDVKYALLTLWDTSKVSKYLVNVSLQKVGLGFDFVGVIVGVGAKVKNYAVGDTVFGVVCPQDKRGALATSVLVDPARDSLSCVTDAEMDALLAMDLTLAFDDSDSDAEPEQRGPFPCEDTLTPLLKLCVFGALYCRAKQALLLMDDVFKYRKTANVLINGADTTLGYTLVQTLALTLYAQVLELFSLVLVVRELRLQPMRAWAATLAHGGARRISVVAYDATDPRGRLCVKKQLLFAAEIIDALFSSAPEPVSPRTVGRCKLDLFVDIVGSRELFQKQLLVLVFDGIAFPFRQRMQPGTTLKQLLGDGKEPFFTKLMRPKVKGSTYVSYCLWGTPRPLYLIDSLVDVRARDAVSPWLSRWTQDLANTLVLRYSYYERFELEARQQWLMEAFQMVLDGELKVRLDGIVDWRNKFKDHIAQLRREDGQVVFKVETF